MEFYRDAETFSVAYLALYVEARRKVSVPEIDFKTQMVLGIFHGYVRGAGYTIGVSEVLQRQDDVVVTVESRVPGTGCGIQPYQNNPYEFVLLPKLSVDVNIAVKVSNENTCVDDLNLQLDVQARFVSANRVDMKWSTPNYSKPITGYRISGDPLTTTTVSDSRLIIESMVPGLYQKVDIVPLTDDHKELQKTTVWLNTMAGQGSRKDLVGSYHFTNSSFIELYAGFAHHVASFTEEEAIRCPSLMCWIRTVCKMLSPTATRFTMPHFPVEQILTVALVPQWIRPGDWCYLVLTVILGNTAFGGFVA